MSAVTMITDISPAAFEAAETAGLRLIMTDAGLTLTDGQLHLCADLSSSAGRLEAGRLRREMLVRAAKIKNADRSLSALDATAGLGEDSLLLAAAGFEVTLCERDPVIAALLRDALRRAAEDPRIAGAVSRMELLETDSIAFMRSPDCRADVILLDPMFPDRKKSGLIKKKFQLLQRLEKPCSDENGLLAAALAAQPYRIIIKRPLKGPELAGRRPDYSLRGSTIRYDCISPRLFSAGR